jgi:hypothetical protein
MRDVQRRRHSQEVPELIPGTFLHLDENVIISIRRDQEGAGGGEGRP